MTNTFPHSSSPSVAVCVVGTGLIGTSLSLALRKQTTKAYVTIGYDHSSDHLRKAQKSFHRTTSSLQEAVVDADIVVLATPVSQMGTIAEHIQPHLASHAIVTDVGSVKEAVIRDISRFLPRRSFIGGHPLAGTEHSGPQNAFAEMFEHAVCLLTPHADHPAPMIDAVSTMWKVCGARIEIIDPQAHDRILCVVSHIPHVVTYATTIASLTMKGISVEQIEKYVATGFQDFTRLAGSDPIMWSDIFLANNKNVIEQIEHLQRVIETLKSLIKKQDGQALAAKIAQPRAFCQRINKILEAK